MHVGNMNNPQGSGDVGVNSQANMWGVIEYGGELWSSKARTCVGSLIKVFYFADGFVGIGMRPLRE